MNQIVTTGIILTRLNYGEADRIITIITPDHGKLRLMAKGVRKSASKLAGGIELFSISAITYIPGKRDISTLISTRMVTHWGNIVKNIDRTMLGYDFLKVINKVTEDVCEEDYYHILVAGLTSLNHIDVEPKLTYAWFCLRLLRLLGHEPNLATDAKGDKLQVGRYIFDFDCVAFVQTKDGKYSDKHIKLMRLLLQQSPEKLKSITDLSEVSLAIQPLIKQLMLQFANG